MHQFTVAGFYHGWKFKQRTGTRSIWRLTAFQEQCTCLLFGSFLAKMRALPHQKIVTSDLLAILLRSSLWASCTAG